MCGIFGVLRYQPHVPISRDLLEASAKRLSHRGPDNLSIFQDDHVGLAHTRLSLLDLSPSSNQPFWDQSQRYALVYNGEIYNFKEIRQDLQNKEVRFHTTGDTEVVLEGFLKYGCEELLKRLDGMFSFAVYDRQERTLTL